MAQKKKIPCVTEPDAGLVHYASDPFTGNITLCGLTDFIDAKERGKETVESCTCDQCIAIFKWCNDHRANS